MILNTRPIDRQDGLRDHFASGVVACPVLEFRPLSWISDDIEDFDALIITSQSALMAADAFIPDKTVPLYAVGQATAEAARQAGFSSVQCALGTAASLLHLIDDSHFESGVYLSARDVSTDLALARPGRITRKVVYEMCPTGAFTQDAVSVITSDKPFVVPFYSPRTLEAFETLLCEGQLESYLRNATAVLIHPRLLSTMTLDWKRVNIAEQPANDSVVTAIRAAA